MATLNAATKFEMSGQFVGSGAFNNPLVQMSMVREQLWNTGTGDNQANQFWQKTASLASTSINFDLDAGSLTDDFGTALVFTTIKAIYIGNLSSTAADELIISGDFYTTVVLGGTAPTEQIDPGGVVYRTNPIDEWTIVATSADVITITSTNTVNYEIVLIGTV